MKYVIDIPESLIEPIKDNFLPYNIEEILKNGKPLKDMTIKEIMESVADNKLEDIL